MVYTATYFTFVRMKEKWSNEQALLQRLIKQMRLDSGLTQTQLSEKLSRPQNFVSKVERGEKRIEYIHLAQICRACGTDIAEFSKLYVTQTK